MNLGTPVHVLAARPVAELQAYEQYTQEHGLPLWRIELQLASIAMRLDDQRAAPGVPLKLSDYLIRPQPAASPPPTEQPQADEPPTEAQAQAAADALGFRPQNRQKPKPKPSPPQPSPPQPSPAP